MKRSTTPAPTSLAWQSLEAHARLMASRHLRELFAEAPDRFRDFSLASPEGDLLLDFSKQRITSETLSLLRDLARAAEVEGWRDRMAAGEAINHTEGRAALHMVLRDTALRGKKGERTIAREVADNLARMKAFCAALHGRKWRGMSGEHITDIVNLGIGGSDLGPRMATRALAAFQHPDIRVHFVANLDGGDLAPLLASLNPRATLFIVTSKTFGTEETLTNARAARDWLSAYLPARRAAEASLARHFVAVTGNTEAAKAFGIPDEQIFAFGDWVGGRFSLWSPVGLAIALATGFSNFEALLAGARAMDQHFLTAPLPENLPITLALLDVWNVNFIGAASHGIFPYSQSLELFPAYLQQLEMESLGKSVDRQGLPLAQKSCPILWGGSGTLGQHSFFQLLHQGGAPVPSDFILLKHADFPLPGHHARLVANALAQSAALAFGQTGEEAKAAGVPDALLPYRVFPGNQPSTTLLLERLTPHTLGQLLALYEHKVFTVGALWNINVFDQWGVELGKRMAKKLLPFLEEEVSLQDGDGLDASTRGLISAFVK
ncbi:MAG: glucose-6-phosphate isomerase [Zoogloeaceae bacterium]|jgi:glucose-6-phosphate isomerase|nr:glucose-6-phosphate isomerase [Zoogloeaceae bacterium]